MIGFKRQVMCEPVGERYHFAHDLNGNVSVGVGDIGSDIINVRA
jgi:hypothetical protein